MAQKSFVRRAISRVRRRLGRTKRAVKAWIAQRRFASVLGSASVANGHRPTAGQHGHSPKHTVRAALEAAASHQMKKDYGAARAAIEKALGDIGPDERLLVKLAALDELAGIPLTESLRNSILAVVPSARSVTALLRVFAPGANSEDLARFDGALASRADSAAHADTRTNIEVAVAAVHERASDADFDRLVQRPEATRYASDVAISLANGGFVDAVCAAAARTGWEISETPTPALRLVLSEAGRVALVLGDVERGHSLLALAPGGRAGARFVRVFRRIEETSSPGLATARSALDDDEPVRALEAVQKAIATHGEDESLLSLALTLKRKLGLQVTGDDVEGLLALARDSITPMKLLNVLSREVDVEQFARMARYFGEVPATEWRHRASKVAGLIHGVLAQDASAQAFDRLVLDHDAARLACDWAARNACWEIGNQVAAAVDRAVAAADQEVMSTLSAALAHAARVRFARGDFSVARRMAEASMSMEETPRAASLLKKASEQADIAARGWPKGRLKAPARMRDNLGGAIGYVLQNSLPYTTVGYSTRSADIAEQLVKAGWPVEGVTRPGYPLNVPEGQKRGRTAIAPVDRVGDVEYRRLPAASGLGFIGKVDYHARELVRLDEHRNWQLLHAASNAPNGLAAVQAAASLGIPSIYEVRGLWHLTRASRFPGFETTDQYRMLERLEIDACHGATRVLTITEAVKAILVDRGIDEAKVTVVPNGVDASAVEVQAKDQDLKHELGLNNHIVIGYVGSLVSYEGLDVLLRAVDTLVQRSLPVKLLIVGDGTAREGLERLTIELGLGDRVVFTGRLPRDEAIAHYSLIDIAPFPRRSFPVTETVSPLKPFEAMASEKAIVVSDVAPLTEIVDHEETGLISVAGDPDSLADALARLVADAPLRTRLAKSGRTWVQKNRDWSQISTRVSDVYRELGCTPTMGGGAGQANRK